jgi:hypothetical protein
MERLLPRLILPLLIVALAGRPGTCSASLILPSTTPVYTTTFLDAVTGDLAPTRSTTNVMTTIPTFRSLGNGGQFFAEGGGTVHWDIDEFQPGSMTQRAEDYLSEVYERPAPGALRLDVCSEHRYRPPVPGRAPRRGPGGCPDLRAGDWPAFPRKGGER